MAMVDVHDELLREAEDQIEAWLCELDGVWKTTLAEAADEAERLLDEARADAGEIVALAHVEAEILVADARAEVERIHAQAGEHADVIRALTAAERLQAGDHLTGLREAVDRLRAELSNVVDAAFDAMPAVEATADAIDRAIAEDDLADEAEGTGEAEPAVTVHDEAVIDLTATVEDDVEYAELPPARELVGAGAPAKRGFFGRLFRRD